MRFLLRNSNATSSSPATVTVETCEACPAGHGPSAINRALETVPQGVCEPCAVGFYQGWQLLETNPVGGGTLNPPRNISVCLSCAEGTFSDKEGSVQCQKCAAGYFSDDKGTHTCKRCPKGSFAASPGAERCDTCPISSFGDAKAATSCTPCSLPYESTLKQGTVSETQCQCPADTFAPCLPGEGGDFSSISSLAELKTHCAVEKDMNSCRPCPRDGDCRGFGLWVGEDLEISKANEGCDEGSVVPASLLTKKQQRYECIHAPPLPKKGFWVETSAIYKVFDCYVGDRCPGEGFNKCGDNWEGFVCGKKVFRGGEKNRKKYHQKGVRKKFYGRGFVCLCCSVRFSEFLNLRFARAGAPRSTWKKKRFCFQKYASDVSVSVFWRGEYFVRL